MNGAQKTIKILAIGLAIFIMVSILQAILYAFSWIGGFGSSGNEFYKNTFTDIRSIDIDVNTSNLYIKEGLEFNVEANHVSQYFKSYVKNETLKVEENHRWFGGAGSGEIIITVPATVSLEELKIDAGAGRISIEEITANRLDLDQGAGTLKMTNSNFKEADIDGGAGLLEITSSTLRNLDLDAGVGKVILGEKIY